MMDGARWWFQFVRLPQADGSKGRENLSLKINDILKKIYNKD